MEKAKKLRNPIRATFTKHYNMVMAEAAKEDRDLDAISQKMKLLENTVKKLAELDSQVMMEMVEELKTDKETEEEQDGVDDYLSKWIALTATVESLVHTRPSSPTPSVSHSTAQKSYRLPKTEIRKFGGNVLDWLGWWAQFQKIHEDADLHNADKFQYLVQSMEVGSKAAELVKVYPQTAPNYPKVVTSLKERFGKDKILKRVYVRELLKMIINNSREKTSIATVYDKLEAHLNALESLGITKDQMDVLLFPMVESCLPEDILMAWQRSPDFGRDGKEDATPRTEFEFMMEFIRREVENESQRAMAQVGFNLSKETHKPKVLGLGKRNRCDVPTAASLFSKSDAVGCKICGKTNHLTEDCYRAANSVTKKGRYNQASTGSKLGFAEQDGCIFCSKKNHQSQDCYHAAKMSLEERRQKVRENRCCFGCLRRGHQVKKCKLNAKCSKCGEKHVVVMCPADRGTEETAGMHGGQRTTNATGTNSMSMAAFLRGSSQENNVVLMKTLHVRAEGANGSSIEVRLLLDEGSQRSYIKTSLAKKLSCVVVRNLTLQNNLFGGQVSEVKIRQGYEVTLEGIDKNFRGQFELVNEDIICTGCPIVTRGSWMEELASNHVRLTDNRENTSPEIQILIGSDLWGSIMTGRMIKLSCGMIAVETLFGWTLSGPLPRAEQSCASLGISLLASDKRSLEDMWSLETLGIRDSAERISQEEHEYNVMKVLQEKTVRMSDGRYVVQLPWISGPEEVPNNKKIAERRLINATDKLKKQGEFTNYNKIFKEWEKEGIIERVRPEEEGSGHFLPHHAVYKPESLTTPVRPVFDASCRVGKQPSLNQCLEKGPNLLEMIPAILLRFREKKIGVLSDIRKAFLMIGVTEGERKFQKFLWWESEALDKMVELQHCRVVFGMNCSPFILAAVLGLHLSQVKEEDKFTAGLLWKSLYVDNCVISLDDEKDFQEFKERSVSMLAEAHMELRQWEHTRDGLERSITTVLGLKWNKADDTLFCKIPEVKEEMKISKRSVLSIVSQIFDPIGFTCATVIQPKMMLQDAWVITVDWDDEWSEKNSDKFRKWYAELKDLGKVRIPRRAFGDSMDGLQLHMFCDASKNAYAAVVFSRFHVGEEVRVQLLASKARLAPLDKKKTKKVTIPRLELMGCLIGSRLLRHVRDALSCDGVVTHCWSDSSTALAWIRRRENWGTYVGRRVEEINRLTSENQWRHVPGLMNPADLPSRGCSPAELLRSAWWEGPEWLRDLEKWPEGEYQTDEDAVGEERRKTIVTASVTEIVKLRFSSYLANVRVAAWCRRFLFNAQKNKEKGNIEERILLHRPTAEEMRAGERDLLRQVQQRAYPEKPNIKNLNVTEKNGLYCVRTRLTYLKSTDQFRNPILLPRGDPLVYQLIEYVHRSNCHAGTQFVLGKLRERYWVIHGRKTVGGVIHKCVVCRRHSAKKMTVDPAPLPSLRVNCQFAFQTTGVDLAGPLLMKGGRKAWIALYTCAVYRGVYLDVLDSLSAEEFLDSLEKFTFTVGRPSTIYSDNGTNFVGAQNMLKQLNWKELEDKLQVRQIQWIFNPPTAAWWGGWWERLVRTIKDLLKRMIGTAKLTRRELEKCLAAISYTVNNRPLTTLSEDTEDLVALTPAMFMKDLPVYGLPERDLLKQGDLKEAYRKLQNLKKALRERFRKEYLALLVQKQSEKKATLPKVGDVVLVGQDNKKRFEWPLGKVVELFPGKDGAVRLARVKTAHGFLLRPLQRLYGLEVSSGMEFPATTTPIGQNEHSPQEEDLPVKTRSGREIHRPSRYGKWNL